MRIKIAFIFLASIAVLSVSAQDIDKSIDSLYAPVRLESASDALSRALEITGFNEFMESRLSKSSAGNYVEKVFIEKDSTPFLNNQIEGRELWQVRLNDVDIRTKFARDEGYDLWRRKSFIVLLNPTTGQLMKIYSIPLSKDSICTMRYTADEARNELLHSSKEEYKGFPTIPPKTTFLEALNAAAGCMTPVANEIIGQYIMYSRHGQDPIPVWCITSLGVPEVDITGMRTQSLVKESETTIPLDCVRCIVDAMSGKLRISVSVQCNAPKKIKQGETGGEQSE